MPSRNSLGRRMAMPGSANLAAMWRKARTGPLSMHNGKRKPWRSILGDLALGCRSGKWNRVT
jgi:hypothetical protein